MTSEYFARSAGEQGAVEHLHERTLVAELGNHQGQRVRCCGWVHALRRCGGLTFVTLRERSGLAQVVVERHLVPAGGRAPEAVVEVEGLVARHEGGGAGQRYELHATAVTVLATPQGPPPLPVCTRPGVAEPAPSLLLEQRATALRAPERLAVFRVQSELLAAFALRRALALGASRGRDRPRTRSRNPDRA